MALPFHIRNREDVEKLFHRLGDVSPGPVIIVVVSVDSVRAAPRYYEVIEKAWTDAHWPCELLTQIDRLKRFATNLTKLAEDIFPALVDDSADKRALRNLRAAGRAIGRVRRGSAGLLRDLTGEFNNNLQRVARQRLNGLKGAEGMVQWVFSTWDRVEEILNTKIMMDDVVPPTLPVFDGGEGPDDGSGDDDDGSGGDDSDGGGRDDDDSDGGGDDDESDNDLGGDKTGELGGDKKGQLDGCKKGELGAGVRGGVKDGERIGSKASERGGDKTGELGGGKKGELGGDKTGELGAGMRGGVKDGERIGSNASERGGDKAGHRVTDNK